MAAKRKKKTRRRPKAKPKRRKRKKKAAPPPKKPAEALPPAAVDLVAHAKDQRHRALAAKAEAGETLSRADLVELEEFERLRRERGAAAVPSGAPLLVSTQQQIADVYGVELRTVENWAAEPSWPAGRGGPYDLAVVGPWVRGWRARGSGAPDLDQATTLFRISKARIAEMEEKKKRGELVPLDEVLSTWQTLYTLMRQMLETLAVDCRGKCGRDLLAEINAGMTRLEAQALRQLPAKEGAAINEKD